MRCSLAAKFRYVDRLPTRQNAKASFGSIIHIAIAQFFEGGGDYDNAVITFKTLWANPARAGVEPDYWPKGTSFGSLMGKGLEILANLKERYKLCDFRLIGTEIPFLVPFGEHELTGVIDLVGIEKSGTGKELLTITDHKSSSRVPSTAELALDIQFTTYVYATFQREFWVGADDPEFPGLPNGEWLWETVGKCMDRRSKWHHLYGARLIDAGPRTTTDFQRLYRLCSEIEHAVDLNVAVPTIGESCQWCDYQDPCTLDIPVSISASKDTTDDTRWI